MAEFVSVDKASDSEVGDVLLALARSNSDCRVLVVVSLIRVHSDAADPVWEYTDPSTGLAYTVVSTEELKGSLLESDAIAGESIHWVLLRIPRSEVERAL